MSSPDPHHVAQAHRYSFLVEEVRLHVRTAHTAGTGFGRTVYAIGGNELAARFSGIRVERVKLGVYLLSGASAGVAALLANNRNVSYAEIDLNFGHDSFLMDDAHYHGVVDAFLRNIKL